LGRKLTPLKQRFCQEYIVDLNGTKAWIRAGGSKVGAKSRASESLADPRVVELVASLQKKVADKIEVNATRVIEELAKMAFANMGDYITSEGNLSISKLTRSEWAAVQEYIVDKTGGSGDGERKAIQRIRFKLADKIAALELLGKHLKLFTDKVELTSDDSFVKLLEAARGRVKS
jgi:phage terminase small subunit